ncbi:T9SS type A sorting domain-containing protein [Hymenobacter sp. GOD-10R]|uniref:T9SS type A sorting domain-containing protein n=1 Tax=Hymenobacter sp. GOD-10R TaxID=3093922 RepID=UPI002D77824B|nr:T9SS type A sorting domain-containing protein [Hymenobacter sp. GOD-10R]WRQ26391.1 T9SS type A sorting domain-containing protein [Hymenobacter sp. GOD-10R]
MKPTLTIPRRASDPSCYRKKFYQAGTFLGLLLLSLPAFAQFPRVESFKSNSASGFTLGGSAVLTGNGTTDATGAGYLRLTSNTNNQAGFAIDNTAFPAPQGFRISFEFFSYGTTTTTGADGFSVFLIDGSTTTFRIGATGGSLGYAQKTVAPAAAGVSNGYIGIGIDEFGNFSNSTEGRNGGPGQVANSVAIRGAGNGSSTTDYPYLVGTTSSLPFKLAVPTTRAQSGSGDYRRAFIDVTPVTTNGTVSYRITVRIQYGNAVATAINSYTVQSPPNTLRIGFAGSTGSFNNYHEIRNLSIVQVPYANDDRFGTVYNQAGSTNVLANDAAPGSSLDVASVDLDPNTAGPQASYTVTDKGTFTVDNQGVVTFTPVGTFAGIVMIPYTVKNILGDESLPANITVVVAGSDIATSVSGPTSTNPGTRVTYTVGTTNLGTETGVNIVPTFTIPKGLTNVLINGVAAGSAYNSTTGVVTLPTIASLASGASGDDNTITFTAPATGSYPLATNYTASSADPVASNNSAQLTLVVSGLSSVSTICGTPGKDGVGTLSGGTAGPNTYYPGNSTGSTSTASTITLGPARTGAGTSTTALSAGDLVLVMQMQGATMDVTTNAGTYGSITDVKAGQYEYAQVSSVSGSTITLTRTLNNTYVSNASTSQYFQVVRIPQYSSLALSGTTTGAAWNGTTGGVLAVDVAGVVSLSNNAIFDMNGKGYRGGGGRSYTGGAGRTNTDVRSAPSLAHGLKGEGLAGTPDYVYDGSTVAATSRSYTNGSTALGAPANGGGGGTDYNPATNNGNAGGGGGGNAGAGGTGGYGYNATTAPVAGQVRAQGAKASGGTTTQFFMGGGGGAGSTNDGATVAPNASGAPGGGIILLRSGNIVRQSGNTTATLTLTANGDDAPFAYSTPAGATTADRFGGGGGGGGGTVAVVATLPNGSAANLSSLVTASAVGGTGSNAGYFAPSGSETRGFGPGGGGGGGFIFASAILNSSTATAGAGGITRSGTGTSSSTTDVNFGAAAGNDGATTNATTQANTNIVGGAGACAPALTAALSTSTPNVTRSSTTVNPATYTLTISNTGGAVQGLATTVTMPAGLFSYDNINSTTVVTLVNADGTTSTVSPGSYSVNASTANAPQFSGLSLPAGASLRISFRAAIASAAVTGTVYQADATVTYIDPTRTTSNATTTPKGTMGDGSTAPGSNYAQASSTAEDVTIVRPLPVSLVRFSAAAKEVDAVLSWTTAQEKDNARFEVERSADGIAFQVISTRAGQGTVSTTTVYQYTDLGAARLGNVVYYRLRQIDLDGTSSWSPVQAVRFHGAQPSRSDLALFPNPTESTTTLDMTLLPTNTYQVTLTDLVGRSLQHYQLEGGQLHTLNTQTLPAGAYLVEVRNASVKLVQKLVKQ